MHIKRTAAVRHALMKPVIAGALVLWLVVSALASASPCLHEWLHSDHDAPTHYCVVTALEHGQNDSPNTAVDLAPAAVGFVSANLPIESFFISHETKLYPERGPPVLS